MCWYIVYHYLGCGHYNAGDEERCDQNTSSAIRDCPSYKDEVDGGDKDGPCPSTLLRSSNYLA